MQVFLLTTIYVTGFLLVLFSIYVLSEGSLNLLWRTRGDKLLAFKADLQLQKAGLVYSGSLDDLRKIILPVRQSAFSPKEPVIWMYADQATNTNLFLTNYGKDLRIWFQPKTVLRSIHIVLDNAANNNPHSSNLFGLHLPKQHIELEGNFSKYFEVYCGPQQQIITLQILSPDIMAYLIDKALDVDVEIVEDQVALIIRQGCESLATIKDALYFVSQLHDLVLAAAKVSTL